MWLEAAGFIILLILVLALHVLASRRTRALERHMATLHRQLDAMSAFSNVPAPPRPATSRLERRATEPGTRREPSPRGVPVAEPTPRGTSRGDTLPRDPSPRSVPRLSDPSPRSVPRLSDTPSRAVPRLPDVTPGGGSPRVADGRGTGWTPTHRITFTPDSGRGESWLVMLSMGRDGSRLASTKAEWSAQVTPAWRCGADGTWLHHGQRTPAGARGRIDIEEYRG